MRAWPRPVLTLQSASTLAAIVMVKAILKIARIRNALRIFMFCRSRKSLTLCQYSSLKTDKMKIIYLDRQMSVLQPPLK